MAQRLSQNDSPLKLETPLGADVLIPIHFVGEDEINETFSWEITCLLNADEEHPDPSSIISGECTVKIENLTDEGSNPDVEYTGLCTEISFLGHKLEYAVYRLVLRPWIWLLKQNLNSEIFHEMTAQDAITRVLNRHSSDYSFSLGSETLPTYAYYVQYQEKQYDFVLRLMEENGIFYTHGENSLKFYTKSSSLPATAGGDCEFQAPSGTGMPPRRIYTMSKVSSLRPRKVTADDYNYSTPNTELAKDFEETETQGSSEAVHRYYWYPGGHTTGGDGDHVAQRTLHSLRTDAERLTCETNAPDLRCGTRFNLSRHPVEALNGEYDVVRARHEMFVAQYISGRLIGPNLDVRESIDHPTLATKGVTSYYVGSLELTPAGTYAPPIKTPVPRIHGAQTAVVIGGDEDQEGDINVDEEGRILIRFHWEDLEEVNSHASCRVRVAQIWAGPGWGGLWIPRIGQEVVVEFLNGDPNRPLVTGAVYNGANAVPIELPGDKTQSTIKSWSNPDGDGYNEFRFEDKKDDEEIYIRAERDRLMEILHDDDVTIGNNQTVTIAGTRTVEITAGDDILTLKGTSAEDKYGTSITATGHRTVTLETGDDTLTVQQGDLAINIDSGKGEVEAMQSFEIKVGESSIFMDGNGVTIKGTSVTLEATGKVKTTGSTAEHSADGDNVIKGGMVKIN